MPFSVLFLCTANLCRSPLAELLARVRLGASPTTSGWTLSSAGVIAVEGSLIHPSAGSVLGRRGIDASGFRGHRLTAADLVDADLVLTAETSHRAACTALVPRVATKTFTLLQFAALCDGVGPLEVDASESGQALVDAAKARRGLRQQGFSDDIRDPIGRRMRAFRRCAEETDHALHRIVSPFHPD